MREAVILSAVRVPTGRFLGALKGFAATAARRPRREGSRRAAPASTRTRSTRSSWATSSRPAWARRPRARRRSTPGCRRRSAALTINKVCGSGLKAVMLAAQGIAAGDAEIVVAGGMESMSNCPYLLPERARGPAAGPRRAVDSMIRDGLWDAYDDYHMGCTGEIVAEKYGVTREQQDAVRAARATEGDRRHQGRASSRTRSCPCAIPQKKGEPADVRGGRVAARGHVAGGAGAS